MGYYKNAISRKSTRDFKEKAVGSSTINEIKEFFESCKKLDESIDIEMLIIDSKSAPNMAGCIGYEDYVIKAPHYILITSKEAPHYLENAGYIGEDIVLKLTEMGISTCWVTISDALKFKERLRIEDDKLPVALIAFGYENAATSVKRLDIINQSNVTLKKRSNYEAPKLFVEDAIISEDMNITGKNATLEHYMDLYQALVSACCAPSFLNRQPYRFVIKKGNCILIALEDKETDENDFYLNLGILMLNFYGALSDRSGVYGKWSFDVDTSVLDGIELPENSKAVATIKI